MKSPLRPPNRQQNRKVQCWIFSRTPDSNEPRCLLLKTNKVRGGFWQPVTGTVEPHEGFYEAACREPIEETRFQFNYAPRETGFEFQFESRLGLTFERVFTLYVEDMPSPVIDPKEHQDFKWTHPKEAFKELRFQSNKEGLIHSYKLVFPDEEPL